VHLSPRERRGGGTSAVVEPGFEMALACLTGWGWPRVVDVRQDGQGVEMDDRPARLYRPRRQPQPPQRSQHPSAVDVRDVADVAVEALTTAQHDNQVYAITGPDALTFAEMAHRLSQAVGRTITYVDVPPEAMRAALADLGFPAWQADGLLEEFAMYRRGEAAGVEPGVREALGRPPRAFDKFARDDAPCFA
jgi:hypothetical protein